MTAAWRFFLFRSGAVRSFFFVEKNMATNYQQDGNTMDWNNSTGKSVESGQVVAVSNIAGVAHGDIPAGQWGVLHMTGVFVLPKANGAVTQGQKLYLANGKLTVTADQNPLVGVAWDAADKDAVAVAVRLGF